MTRATVLTLILAMACAPTDGSVTPDPTLPGESLELPVVGVDTLVTPGWMDSPTAEPGETLMTSSALTLGIGEGYASELELEGVELWQGRCLWEGTWRVESADSSEPDTIRADVRGGRLHLEVLAPTRTATLIVTGTLEDGGCSWEDGERSDWKMVQSITIHAYEPTGAVLETPYACRTDDTAGPDLLLMDGQPSLDGLRALPLDDEGEPREVVNAHAARQVPLVLDPSEGVSAELVARPSYLPEGTEPDPILGLGEAVFSGSGTVSLTHPSGPLADIGVATVDEVTGLDLAVVIPFGLGGQDLFLEDGLTYDWSDIRQIDGARYAVTLADRPWVGETQACSKPDPAWVRTSTVPRLDEADNPYGYGTYDQTIVSEPWQLDGVDTVTFSVRLPRARGGEGVGIERTVSFTE